MPQPYSDQERADILKLPDIINANVTVDADALLIACQSAGENDPDGIVTHLRVAALKAKENALAGLMHARRHDPALAEYIARRLSSR
jgi:hypothetical protein